ncbi:MAG: hypothetical protein Q4B82_05385 [Alysiella sp.]|uniref:hypothetical protein n=1 Tax=Alysiella sp. TaxID=1872483 RepID=UPI0026DAF45B|nr:hypothetical protein [Alysiella sp.]MDO4433997.1 hypothetical protein [Alysiella sp.]
MKTRCPCCGAENSLDALLAHDEAREAVWAVAQVGGELGRLAVQYIALFRPTKTALTFDRMAKLLNEILPDMQRQAITRDRVEYPAPLEAWVYGFREMLAKRSSGSLKLPLKSHGYLYEIIASWQGQGLRSPHPSPPPQAGEGINGKQAEASQTLSAAMQLQGLRR